MNGMELRHYSYPAWSFNPERSYHTALANGKPDGLWVSVLGEDDWPSWCRSEQWGLDRLASEHEVVLAAGANILHVQGPLELNSFHDRFSVERAETYGFLPRREDYLIDWSAVKAEFDGIIIAPYIWSQRLRGPSWYYAWDCASGCIWNLGAIESVTRIFSSVSNLVSEVSS